MPATSERWQVELDANDATAYAVLARDERWNGYSIGDLVPPYRAYAQFAVARRESQPPSAACLLLRHPAFNVLIPSGDPEGLEAIWALADMPERTFVTVRADHLPSLARHYAFAEGPVAMLRMAVTAATFRPPSGHEAGLIRLGLANLVEVQAFYGTREGSPLAAPFHDDLLTLGPFYGVRAGDTLAAAGGTHALAVPYGVAAIGNVLTLPAHRGRGYGTAVTAAIVTELLAGSCRAVILNVAQHNQVAVRLYTRLGFRTHCPYQEGQMQRRTTTAP